MGSCFGSPRSLVRNTDFSGRRRTTWWNGRAIRIRVSHIPVYSLYGEHREPTPEMLEGLDAIVVDLQDVGARYYTFIWTLYLTMRACESARIAVVVLGSAKSVEWPND